ncbi:hypothetical protein ACFL5U_04155, partial [Candidatus Margulisiibacteriota bacterium]
KTARDIFFSDPVNGSQQKLKTAERLLNNYMTFAGDLGISCKEVKTILKAQGVFEKPKADGEISYETIRDKKAARIGVANLPQDVKAALSDMGVYEEIKQDERLGSLNLVYDIAVSTPLQAIMGGASGASNDVCKEIWVDVINQQGEAASPWQIASTVYHEYLHIVWSMEHFNESEFLRVTPNERNSFVGEERALQSYLKAYIAEHYAEIREQIDLHGKLDQSHEVFTIVDYIIYLQEIVAAANAVLGYPPDEMGVRTDLPADSDELDLDTYPINLAVKQENYEAAQARILQDAGFPMP